MRPVSKNMQPNRAERRQSRRYHLCLETEATLKGDAVEPVKLHDISRTGFLMECSAPLGVGEGFEIHLMGGGSHRARAIWACGSLLGCEFQHKLTPGACSAALLKAKPVQHPPAGVWWSQDSEVPQGTTNELQRNGRAIGVAIGAAIACWAAILLMAAVLPA